MSNAMSDLPITLRWLRFPVFFAEGMKDYEIDGASDYQTTETSLSTEKSAALPETNAVEIYDEMQDPSDACNLSNAINRTPTLHLVPATLSKADVSCHADLLCDSDGVSLASIPGQAKSIASKALSTGFSDCSLDSTYEAVDTLLPQKPANRRHTFNGVAVLPSTPNKQPAKAACHKSYDLFRMANQQHAPAPIGTPQHSDGEDDVYGNDEYDVRLDASSLSVANSCSLNTPLSGCLSANSDIYEAVDEYRPTPEVRPRLHSAHTLSATSMSDFAIAPICQAASLNVGRARSEQRLKTVSGASPRKNSYKGETTCYAQVPDHCKQLPLRGNEGDQYYLVPQDAEDCDSDSVYNVVGTEHQ